MQLGFRVREHYKGNLKAKGNRNCVFEDSDLGFRV